MVDANCEAGRSMRAAAASHVPPVSADHNLAAAQMSSLGRELDEVAKRMTPNQIAEAQRMAREWMEKHQQ